MQGWRWGLAVVAAMLLLGCAQTRVIREETAATPPPSSGPVERPSRPVGSGLVTVKRGDTLYSIAMGHDVDWREIARLNGIAAPYVIHPGQMLRLPGGAAPMASRPATSVATPAARPAAEPPASSPPARQPGLVAAVLPPPPPRPVADVVPQTPPSVPSRGNEAPPAPDAASLPPTETPPTAPVSGPPAPVVAGSARFVPGQWRWPTEGQLISAFVAGDRARQGIAIAGREGQPVQAAAAGTVVYSGAGLVGYGELIIIKHNDEWLSAYGHNRRRLVPEGAAVAAGQTIAELGRTGTSRDMLHFEIRRNGKPVDPKPLLPRR